MHTAEEGQPRIIAPHLRRPSTDPIKTSHKRQAKLSALLLMVLLLGSIYYSQAAASAVSMAMSVSVSQQVYY